MTDPTDERLAATAAVATAIDNYDLAMDDYVKRCIARHELAETVADLLDARDARIAELERDHVDKAAALDLLTQRTAALADARTIAAAAQEDVAAVLPVVQRHFDYVAAPPGISDEQRDAVLKSTAYQTALERLKRLRQFAARAAAETKEE